jgi:hypothetical protein
MENVNERVGDSKSQGRQKRMSVLGGDYGNAEPFVRNEHLDGNICMLYASMDAQKKVNQEENGVSADGRLQEEEGILKHVGEQNNSR